MYLVWRGEHEAVVLLRLQQAPQGLELVDLGEHALAGQQHVQVTPLVQHLADGGDGAVQLGQALVQLLHLQIQRLGLHLTDLLHLQRGQRQGGEKRWARADRETEGIESEGEKCEKGNS